MAARTDLDGDSVDDYAANTVGVENLIAAVEGATSLRRLIFAFSRLAYCIGCEKYANAARAIDIVNRDAAQVRVYFEAVLGRVEK